MKSINTPLIVFARRLVDQMRYINYPSEWSKSPLNKLIPQFIELLNYHPDKPGKIISNAYSLTFPVSKNGNINQLHLLYPDLFSQTKQYYLDEYEARYSVKNPSTINNPIPIKLLADIFAQINSIFADMSVKQQNEHRTLEEICFALQPIYYCGSDTEDMGRELAEHADMWRNASAVDREKIYRQSIS